MGNAKLLYQSLVTMVCPLFLSYSLSNATGTTAYVEDVGYGRSVPPIPPVRQSLLSRGVY